MRNSQDRWIRFVNSVLISGFAILATVAALAITGISVFGFPQIDEPTNADAVLVLGPPTVQRLIVAQSLVDEGLAKTIVISAPPGVVEDESHPRVRNLCLGNTHYSVRCLTPDPFTTQGEARMAKKLLNAQGWSSIIVVTSITHVSRARLLFDRCVEPAAGQIEIVTDRRDYTAQRWVSEFIYQAGAFLKAAINPEC